MQENQEESTANEEQEQLVQITGTPNEVHPPSADFEVILEDNRTIKSEKKLEQLLEQLLE